MLRTYCDSITLDLIRAFDPLRKSGGQKCCNAQHGFFDDVVGYDPRGLRKLMRRREFITPLGASPNGRSWRTHRDGIDRLLSSRRIEAQGNGMLGLSRWQIFKTSAAAVLAVGTISLLLIYFIPAPPSTVTMATGNKGTTFEYFGQRYRDIFARSHVELKLRETDGAVDNIELLKNPNSGVQIALDFGGISDGEPAPGVLSLGNAYTNPFWIFYSSDEPLDRLSQLKGKRIAVGPVGSGTHVCRRCGRGQPPGTHMLGDGTVRLLHAGSRHERCGPKRSFLY